MLKAANEIRFIQDILESRKKAILYILILYMLSKYELNPSITFFQQINIAKFD